MRRFQAKSWIAVALSGLTLISSCRARKQEDPARVSLVRVKPLGTPLGVAAPLGLPPVPVPLDNPMTTQTVALGRSLFYDKRLSLNDSMSCATCHNPALNFTDGQPHSLGVGGKTGVRNAPTLLNAAYNRLQFWDGRAPTLEEQVGGPMANPIEMNQPHEVAVNKLNADQALRKRFEAAFGPGPITLGKIEQAIASFERTLVSGNSLFDRYEYGGDKRALSPAAIRGLAIFEDLKRGNCVACHVIGPKFSTFTDGMFHNLGVGVDDSGQITDLGRYSETKKQSDKGAFATPSLRNIANTPPYMHDGSLKTLKEVVDFYAGNGNSNPHLDPRISAIRLSGKDRQDLVEFLESLSSELPPNFGSAPKGE